MLHQGTGNFRGCQAPRGAPRREPTQAQEILVLMKRVLFDPPTPLDEHRPDVLRGLAEVIQQALQKPLDRRWPSVAAFAAALAPYGPARQASYAERIARVQGADVVPSRPTEPTAFPARSVVDAPSTVASVATPATPQGAPARWCSQRACSSWGCSSPSPCSLVCADRAGAPEPITTATAGPPAIEATAKPTGPVTVAPAGTATAPPSAEPATSVAGTAPSTMPYAKPAATTKPQAKLRDGADRRWPEARPDPREASFSFPAAAQSG
jgi:eukaryotic-like serine/threonine-protein kinase